MTENTPEPQTPESGATVDQGNPDDGVAELGDAGKKALDRMKAERNEAKQQAAALQAQIAEFATFKESLASALGIKQPDGEGDVLTTVQQELADMRRDNLILGLANELGITDKGDIKLLKDSSLEGDALTAMAERLKPGAPSGTPQPDLSQGPNPLPAADPGKGVSRLRHAYANPAN